jgi:hypothetical protein
MRDLAIAGIGSRSPMLIAHPAADRPLLHRYRANCGAIAGRARRELMAGVTAATLAVPSAMAHSELGRVNHR